MKPINLYNLQHNIMFLECWHSIECNTQNSLEHCLYSLRQRQLLAITLFVFIMIRFLRHLSEKKNVMESEFRTHGRTTSVYNTTTVCVRGRWTRSRNTVSSRKRHYFIFIAGSQTKGPAGGACSGGGEWRARDTIHIIIIYRAHCNPRRRFENVGAI